MKIIKSLQISGFFLLISFNIFSQVYFTEGFEHGGSKPENWKNIYVNFTHSWEYHDGGYGSPFGTGFDSTGTRPDSAYSGNYNAVLQYENSTARITKLVTIPIDLEFAIKPELRFYHAQIPWSGNQDELVVYYRVHKDSAWYKLDEYTSAVTEWTERKMFLPDTNLTSTYYIAFEGKAKWGYGVCIDSVTIVETGIIPSYVQNVTCEHYNNESIPAGSSSNPILKLRVKVYGNTGSVNVDSLAFKSLNSNNSDLAPSGVKLYWTEDENFNTSNQLGAGKNFSNDTVIFNNLDYTMPTGYSYLWLTYDVAGAAVTEDTLDASFLANSFKAVIDTSTIEFDENIWFINDTLFHKSGNDTMAKPRVSYYPESALSPSGYNPVVKSIFYDNFNTGKGWYLDGEFERDAPQGLGDSINASPDPDNAFIGSNVLGYDLTGDGNYGSNIDTSYIAESPLLDCYYYKNIKLAYYRWLNIESNSYDEAAIKLSADSGTTWKRIWTNPLSINDKYWVYHSLNTSFIDRKRNAKFRFTLGPTDGSTNLSGWNIDNVAMIGDFISRDVSIKSWVAPISGCGHSDNDTVKLLIKNTGADALNDTVAVMYKFTGGVDKEVYDTVIVNLAPEQEVLFAFDETIDLSNSYFYDSAQVYAAVTLKDDQYQLNDTAWEEIKVIPTYRPPLTENFESGFGYWQKIGDINSWEYGKPTGTVLNTAASGDSAWVTDLDSAYAIKDSSYLESPCFDFSNARHPVFEWKYQTQTQNDTDGVAIFYSIDTGATWQLVDTHQYSFDWNWYTVEDTIEALGTPGWDSVSNGYITAKQFLPAETGNKPLVKFRVGFEAMDSTIYEGVAFDDVRVFDAPPDLGIDTILEPNSACELSAAEDITVAIRNYGMNKVLIGDTIMVGVEINTDPVVIDTFVMTKELAVNDTIHQTLTKGFDLYQSGTYDIKAYPVTKVNNNIYSDSTYNNDTTTKNILVKKAFVELGSDIYSVHPDTIELDAYEEPGNTYVWKEVGSPDTITTDSVYKVPGEGTYMVIVRNNVPCFAYDTVYIEQLIADIGVSALNYPYSDCELGDSVPVTIEITNFGTDTIRANYPAKAYYQMNGGPLMMDNIMINDTVWPDSTYLYTFDSVVNMVNDTIYSFNAFTEYIDDTITSNDTLNENVEVYGYPEFDLKPADTTMVRFNYTLNAAKGNTGLVSYLWEDSLSTDSLFVIDTLGTDYYTVTVADIHNCPAVDSARVKLVIPSVGVTELVSPNNSCGAIQSENFSIKVANLMNDTIYSGTKIPMVYRVDSDPLVNDTLEIATDMHPGDTLSFSFASATTISSTGEHNLLSFTQMARDSVPDDDSIKVNVTVFPEPQVFLGNDTTVEAGEYTLNPGAEFADYKWHDGSTDQTFSINPETLQPLRTYAVTVTDTNACVDNDAIIVDLLFNDLAVTDLFFTDTACSYSDTQSVKIELTNTGTFNLNGEEVIVFYEINSGEVQSDTFNIQGTVFLGTSFNHIFDSTATLKDKGDYIFNLVVKLEDDAYESNDTLIDSIYLYGSPEIDFGAEEDTLEDYFPATLDAGSGYLSYKWQDGSTSQSFNVNASGWYAVTVTDNNSCEGTQTVYVSELVDILELGDKQTTADVYPNPVNDKLIIDIRVDKPAEILMELYDLNGKRLINKKIPVENDYRQLIDVSTYPAGAYYLKMQNLQKGKAIIKKIMIVD